MAHGQKTAWWLSRLVEPSTHAGIAVAIAAGAQLASDATNPTSWGMLFASLGAILAPERGPR